MREVADGVYRLGSKYHNFYFITDGGKATLVDAGASKEIGKLDTGLLSLGMSRADVELIVLTHAHADHIGFANEASGEGTLVKAHADEAPRVRDTHGYSVAPGKLPLWRPAIWGLLFALVKAGVTNAPRVKDIATFEDGETLDVPGRPRAIHTPGHTEGHAAFYLEDRGLLFTGDALVTMNLKGGRRGPQSLADVFHTDAAQARTSLSLLTGLDTKLVLPGHGNPWEGQAADAVKAALGKS